MAVNSASFSVISKLVEADISKKVDYIDVSLEMNDYIGTVFISDIMCQGGGIPCSWIGHVSEIRWSFDNA